MKSLRILIVDDEPMVRTMLEMVCQRLGHTVAFEAESGDQAFAWFKQNIANVDVVLTDREMANGDGIQLIRDIKAVSPSTPIIMLSGGMIGSDTEAARDAGASAVLHKPLNLQLLKETIRVCGTKQ